MKTAVVPLPTPRPSASDAAVDAEARSAPAAAERSGTLRDYLALTKPRIVTLVLATVMVGYLLGGRGASNPLYLALTLLGTGLVAAGGSVWNQVLEHRRDALMRRTSRRPIPDGRVSPARAGLFGAILAVLGLLLLAAGPHPAASAIAAATFVLYGWVYTYAKPWTTMNTAIGAAPGALPPVIGWVAATGRWGPEAWSLFLILFLWQFPHFLAIAWIHRADYRKAGLKMLPTLDPLGRLTGRQAAGHALALVPAGLLPSLVGLAGPIYCAGALLLGLWYLAAAARFWQDVRDETARRLLRVSILHLPLILLLLLIDPLPV